ncbi:hypothetical protein [Gryllotalpicola protaetiae]|uniref:Uncharacterized protein n=1 Tax=Gryllotalpicola protaetiae TaxID=2419771 RepID=A0A387C0H1_9MICO|nr:hypothetical protein [Gryllotalpicola protaetiae]AYG04041.1 hypothetical protein D7I44_11220 [Gryllotalpicola protaetiae]
MPFERQYAEHAAAAEDAGPESVPWALSTAASFALPTDEKPVVAASSEIIGRLLVVSGNEEEGTRMFDDYASPALVAIGQPRRAEALRRLTH